ncbi:MAG: serine protease [Frankiales bacterium]|nr:serine protease [Frankiales bacterium]
MTSYSRARALIVALLIATGLVPLTFAQAALKAPGAGDATVIAVIDNAFTPYHWDYLASQMPQALNSDRSDDLPLTTSPDKWLPGFPKPSSFGSYQSLKLHLATDEGDKPDSLDAQDTAKWKAVKGSSASKQNYYWMPGTKVIGAMTFGTPASTGGIHGPTSSHGTGTTSVSVGNLHGTCPECLLVFLQYTDTASAEAAIGWAMKQPWIDAISNSYGMGSNDVYGRDRVYSGSDVNLQRQASGRGQTIFFSAGNGFENAFVTPTTTLLSSQEGPDWIVTVGAVDPGTRASYTGPGKPVDISSIGSSYPSAYGATSVSTKGASGFSGTSNATPVTAGTYSRALYLARRAMAGPSRTQTSGVISVGRARCAAARRSCEIGDGRLLASELRQRLFQGATHTGKGFSSPVGVAALPASPADSAYASEGYGYLLGRLKGDVQWAADFNRVAGPLLGTAAAPKRPADEAPWFVVDSWCRQHIWGEWSGGAYRGTLPADDPTAPARSAYHEGCQALRHT